MSLYPIVLEMKKLLHQATTWIDKAEASAAARKFDANTLLTARLAPDMFPLINQFQSACDQAKFAASRGAGKQPPSHPDTEKTFEEVRARIASVISHLDTFTAADFDGADKRTISLPRWEGKSLTTPDYIIEHAQANFYFHLTMAYAILRHNGVDVGKRDFLGTLSFK